MEKLRGLIHEEEKIVERREEDLNSSRDTLEPEKVKEEEVEIEVVKKEIDKAKLYERQQTYRIIQENEEYRRVEYDLQSLDTSVAMIPEKPQGEEEIARRKQLAQDKKKAIQEQRKLDMRREKREQDELKEIQTIEERIAQEKARARAIEISRIRALEKLEARARAIEKDRAISIEKAKEEGKYKLEEAQERLDRYRHYLRTRDIDLETMLINI